MAIGRKFSYRKQPPGWRALLALVLIGGQAHAAGVELDYRTTGFATKYNNDGWEGFTGFNDSSSTYNKSGNKTGDKAKDAADQGKTAADRAKDLNSMANQIGKDFNKLLPLMSQAMKQDAQNNSGSSGSSKLGSLMASPYKPPVQYQKPFWQMGLRTNNNLYTDGPAKRDWLNQQAQQLQEVATQSYADASKSLAATQQLSKLGQDTSARGERMGAIKSSGSGNFRMNTQRNSAGLQGLGNASNGKDVGVGSSQKISNSNISSRTDGNLESTSAGRSAREAASSGSAGGGGGRGVGSSQSSSGSSEENSRAEKIASRDKPTDKTEGTTTADLPPPGNPPSRLASSFAALDALFDETAKQPSKDGARGPGTAATTAARAGDKADPASESIQMISKILNVAEEDAEEPLVLAKASPPPDPASEQGSGFVLEEESLFLRIHQSISRAATEGRVSRLSQR